MEHCGLCGSGFEGGKVAAYTMHRGRNQLEESGTVEENHGRSSGRATLEYFHFEKKKLPRHNRTVHSVLMSKMTASR